MIERYARKEMQANWGLQRKYRLWFEIEAHAASAMARRNLVPQHAVDVIWQRGIDILYDTARIDQIERETKHDVIAFLTFLAEQIGPEARILHRGLTSSDLLDTALNIQLRDAADLLIDEMNRLLGVLANKAHEYRNTPCIGRSHGIHAEPTTFGVKLAMMFAEMSRAQQRLNTAKVEISTIAISGPVGTFASVDPEIEAEVAKAFGMEVEPVSSQIIPRDRHAAFFTCLSLIACSIERIAVEIRHLQRTEVSEAEEFFGRGQKGSSSMPHKRNPVLSENLTGLARVLRSHTLPAMENVALWHERDISHSSVERFIAPDATITLDFALGRLTSLLDRLVIYPENMSYNLEKQNGLIFSQNVLLALIDKGLAREDAYLLVQKNAMSSWQTGTNFLQKLAEDEQVRLYLADDEIDRCADLKHQLRHVDLIFARVFDSGKA